MVTFPLAKEAKKTIWYCGFWSNAYPKGTFGQCRVSDALGVSRVVVFTIPGCARDCERVSRKAKIEVNIHMLHAALMEVGRK